MIEECNWQFLKSFGSESTFFIAHRHGLFLNALYYFKYYMQLNDKTFFLVVSQKKRLGKNQLFFTPLAMKENRWFQSCLFFFVYYLFLFVTLFFLCFFTLNLFYFIFLLPLNVLFDTSTLKKFFFICCFIVSSNDSKSR